VRIAINARFLSARVTGVQRYAREVVPRLCDAADIVLFVPRGVAVPAEWRERARTVTGSLAGHAWEQLELPGRVRAYDCDVCLHLSGTASVRGGPHVMVMHDVLPLTDPAWFSARFAAWYRIAAGRAARGAAAIVTVSAWSRDRIIARLGIEPERVFVTSQGVAPFDRPLPPEMVRPVLERLDLTSPYVLALGAGDRRKNATFLEAVARCWRAQHDDAPAFVVVGDANRRVHGAQPGSSHDVRSLGRVSDEVLHALYTGAAAFAFPSLAEGFGRPPLEALACGAPIVAADYGPAAEVLGEEAAIVPLQPDAWVRTLRDVVAADSAALRRARAGRTAARWRWEQAMQTLLAACDAAAPQRARPAA